MGKEFSQYVLKCFKDTNNWCVIKARKKKKEKKKQTYVFKNRLNPW